MTRSVRSPGLAVLTLATALVASCAQSDAGITTKVRARLDAQRDLSSGSIRVDTAGKVVTLSGTAASDAERRKAVEVAKGTEGVQEVVDRLTVNPAAAAPGNPAPPASAPPPPNG